MRLYEMTFKDLLLHASQQIRAFPMRSFLTIFGIIISVAGIICVATVLQGMTQSINRLLANMGPDILLISTNYMKGTARSNLLTTKEWQILASQTDLLRDVTASSSSHFSQISFGDENASVSVLAVSESQPELYRLFPLQGRFIHASDEVSRARVVVISEALKTRLNLPENACGSIVFLGSTAFTVIGVVPAKLNETPMGLQIADAYVSFAVAQEFSKSRPAYSFGMRVKSSGRMSEAMQRIRLLLHHSLRTPDGEAEDFRIETADQIRESAAEIQNMISRVFYAIISISLFVSGISIMNMMLVSVNERTREIGLFKALGASQCLIRLQFFLEAAMLAVAGACAGSILGWLLGNLIIIFLPDAMQTSIPVWAVAGAVCISVIIALISAIIPAAKAAKLPAVIALTKE